MIISIDTLLYRIEAYHRIFWGIVKYRIAEYENRYRIVTNHLIYTPRAYPNLDTTTGLPISGFFNTGQTSPSDNANLCGLP